MMTKKIIVLSLAVFSASCRVTPENAKPDFTARATVNALAPNNLYINVKNLSTLYLCISIADLKPGSGFFKFEPNSGSEIGENRPPAKLLAGFDLTSGLMVIAPKDTATTYVDISQIDSVAMPAHRMEIVIRAAACADFFASRNPLISERTVSVSRT